MKNQLSILLGFAAGIGTILFMMAFWTIRKELLFDTYVYYGSLSVTIMFMWIAGNKLLSNPEINFSLLLRNLFSLFVISEVLYFSWYFYLINYVDTQLLDVQKMQMISYLQELKEKTSDISEVQQFNQSIQELEKNGLPEVSLQSVLLQLGRGIIGGFVMSYLLTMVIIRRK